MWLVGRPGGSPDWRREGLAPQTAGVFPTALQNNKHMGQLTSNTWRADQPATRDPGGHELLWLGLLDRLYALVESSEGVGPADWRQDWPLDWPPDWQPLIRSWAACIGARSIELVEPLRGATPPPRHAPGLSARRCLMAQPPGPGPALRAQSVGAEGFSATQEREFQAFCSHFYTALSIQASLHAARQSLACLHGVIDALPMCIVMLDERLNVVLLNRQAREWLARTERATIQGQRICLSSQQAAFESAVIEWAADAFKPRHHLHLNGLEIHLKKLVHPAAPEPPALNDRVLGEQRGELPVSVLLQIHEGCDGARARDIAAPPAALARHLQQQFVLTDKELPLAWNLAQGMSLKQYAALSGRSVETLRAQLKSVFRKLGVTSQSGIGLVLFEASHALTLQSMGVQLARATADRTAASPAPQTAAPWR